MIPNENGRNFAEKRMTNSTQSTGRCMIGKIVLFSMIPLLLIVSSSTNASGNDQDLDVLCSWDKNLLIQYNDNGVGVSESMISPIITITNNMDLAVTIKSVAIHMDWQKEGENYYSWTLGLGSIGQEIGPGEEMNVEDTWFNLIANLVGQHTYRILVDYQVQSDNTPRKFVTADRSDFTIEFKKTYFLLSFLKGSDILFSLIPVSILGIALYKIQSFDGHKMRSTSIQGECENKSELIYRGT